MLSGSKFMVKKILIMVQSGYSMPEATKKSIKSKHYLYKIHILGICGLLLISSGPHPLSLHAPRPYHLFCENEEYLALSRVFRNEA